MHGWERSLATPHRSVPEPFATIVAKSWCNPLSSFVFNDLRVKNGTLFQIAPWSAPQN